MVLMDSVMARHHQSMGSILLCLLLTPSCLGAHQPELTPDQAQIIQRIDAAVYQRSQTIATYSVQEQYSLYRNGEATPSAQETIHTVYTRATGKEYTPIAQSGSALLRSLVIDKLIAGEKEINLAANRESSWIISRNYEMRPEPTPVLINNRECILVNLKPRRKSPHLFEGKIWVDASDYTVVRLEGAPSQSPSFFAGDSIVSRDYARIGGYSMATHAEARSHSMLFGDTLLKIDYTNYQIQREPTSAATIP